MKVVMLNYDFKVFWKGRLIYLHQFLATKNISFQAVELFGKGSAYSFDSYNNEETWWTCLFPTNSADEVSKAELKKAFFGTLDRINPDVVIASSIVFYAGALGMRWAKKNRKKFIVFENAKPSQFKRNFLVQGVKDLLLEQADGFWLPSADYDSEYPELYNLGIHFFYGYCCVDNEIFKNPNTNAFDHHRIICVARLVPIKNIDNLLRSWQIVEKESTNYKLIIIGDGPESTHLKELSNILDLRNVEFLGAIDNENIPAHFYNSDAFILPSLSETWGLVVNEAMAGGLPILLSDKINAAHTLLKEGVTGFGFDPLNAESMAHAILKYINLDTQSKADMAAKSLEIIDRMGYENMGSRLVEAITKITSQPFKKPGLIAALLIKIWDGKYSTFAWNRL